MRPEIQCLLEPVAAFAHIAPGQPELPQPSRQAQGLLGFVMVQGPLKRRTQIVVFSLQARQPGRSLHAIELWCRGLGQPQEIGQVPVASLVHLSGLNQALIKKRHIPLSEQFQQVENDLHRVRQWLKRETRVEVKTEALLPELWKRLENSGHIPREYFDSVEQRKRRIADLIGFLASAGISDNVTLHAWQKNASPADRELLESRLCHFDFECFFEMGRLFRKWAQNLPTSSEIFFIDGFRSSGFEA